MKKIIQITAVPATQYDWFTIVALDDDGNIFYKEMTDNNLPQPWRRVEKIRSDL